MARRLDPDIFPLREGITIPRELVAPHVPQLLRRYGGTVESLVQRGGISVFEFLTLLPSSDGKPQAEHCRDIFDLTLSEAMAEVQPILKAHQAKKEADAEAAMLAMMEAEEASMATEQPVG